MADVTEFSNGNTAMKGYWFSRLDGKGNSGVVKIRIGGSVINLQAKDEKEFLSFCEKHNISITDNRTHTHQSEATPCAIKQ